MYGFKCDKCGYVTQNEDDHKVTDDGEYLCLVCYDSEITRKETEKQGINPVYEQALADNQIEFVES